jgi:hypothetical protein
LKVSLVVCIPESVLGCLHSRVAVGVCCMMSVIGGELIKSEI